MRVLLDTNVLIAAFATRGLCADVLRTVLAEHELVVGSTILVELQSVLVAKLQLSGIQAKKIVSFVREQADVITAEQPAVLPSTDVDDQWVLAAAAAGNVDVLITGDKDLLNIADKVNVPIVTPRGFWEQLKG